MTKQLLPPEMMARAIVSEPDWWRPPPNFLIDFDRLREHIAQAIEAERQQCIEAVKRAANDSQTDDAAEYKGYKAGIVAALAAIRTREY